MENPYMINRSCWRTRRPDNNINGPGGQWGPGNGAKRPDPSQRPDLSQRPDPSREGSLYRAEGADNEDSLIIESNTVYEIDLECLKRHQRRKPDVSAANKAY